MRCAFVFVFGIICIKLLFDAFMGSIDKEEKAVYALGELLLIFRQRRAIRHVFDDGLGSFKAYIF